mmetsp:Transcript_40702/g.101801  ORF Transcript_40702/g.101801 Transcript_40702/m.101801 type:complete len:179 (+) Transcript_40702:64-600(+)
MFTMGGSRDLMRPEERPEPIVHPLTIHQVGLGQSRGYLHVRELPDGAPVKKWAVLLEDKLWLFDSPDTQRPGQHIPLDKALVNEVGSSRSPDQLTNFEVRTRRGKSYSLKAKSSGDANMWIRAMKQHTAKETENQIMDRAERLICLGELASAARIMEQARRLRKLGKSRAKGESAGDR